MKVFVYNRLFGVCSGLVLSSFFYGYIWTQVPGGYLADRFGGKWVLGLGCLGTTALTLVTPIAAYNSLAFLLAIRVVEGFGEVELWRNNALKLLLPIIIIIAFF